MTVAAPVVEGYAGQAKKVLAGDPWPRLYDALSAGQILQEMVTGIEHLDDKRVQLVVSLGPVKGIVLPDDLGENLNAKTSLVGQHVVFKVKRCDRENAVVYLSRKDAIAKMAEDTWQYLVQVCKPVFDVHAEEVVPAKDGLRAMGDPKSPEAAVHKGRLRNAYRRTAELSPTLTGVVRWVTARGAYVDIGGIIAFLPVAEATWSIQRNCRAVLKSGDALDVKVLDIEPESRQVLVSSKATTPDPWLTVERKYKEGGVYFGTVKMVADTYVLVELEPGVAGLAFRAAMEEIPDGSQVVVKLLAFDIAKRRVRLNLARLLERGA
jgi:ribosomal protein S1